MPGLLPSSPPQLPPALAPPPIVIQPDDPAAPPAPPGPVPQILLLSGFVELVVSVGPGGLLEMGLRVSYQYQVKGYGIVLFVWEETRLLYPADLPLGA